MSRGAGNATSKAEREAILMLRGRCSYGHAADFLCMSPSIVRGTWSATRRAEARACRCDAYPFPHRTGGGECEECGCANAPDCEHWAPVRDPYGTGDHWHVEHERVD